MGGAWALLASRSGAEPTLVRKPFAEFPLALEGWTGQDLKMDERVLDLLKLSDYVMRAYVPPVTGASAAGAFDGRPAAVGRSGVSLRRVLRQPEDGRHVPLAQELPARGRVAVQVDGDGDGRRCRARRGATINRVVIEKGFDRQMILYWYQDRGRVVASEYAAKGYLIWDAMTRNRTDGALVRISTPVVGSEEEAYRHALDFLRVSWEPLLRHLPG